MTLDEAIQHCRDQAGKLRKDSVKRLHIGLIHAANDSEECAAEHEQLAEWLTELKQRIEAEIAAPPKTNADRIRQMTDEELADFFCQISQCCSNDAGCSMCPIYDGCAQNVMCVERWLKQEVSEDAGTD